MKAEVKTPVMVVIIVIVVALVGYFGSKMIGGSGDLDQGQVKYTPGKPPWMETDPSKKGPGASPNGGGMGAPGGAPAATQPGSNVPSNAPPGMGAPALGNGGPK
jgi:hypothetical protein